MTPPPIIVGASAGSGKTYRLTQEVTRALAPGAAHPARIEGLLAVTYTRKAQAELASRIRRTLVGVGAFDEAARLPVAYLGTVHAVCMRLLEELAIDAGLSPYPEVMPDDRGLRMRAAIEEALPRALVDELDRLARRLEIFYDTRTQRHDWPRRILEIMELTRGNRIGPEALPAMGRRSATSLMGYLPPSGDSVELDGAFEQGLERAVAGLTAGHDGTKATAEVLARICDIQGRRRRGEVQWSDWAWAAKAAPGARCRGAVAALIAAAARCESHPDLHDDLRRFTLGMFDAARHALTGYGEWKARRRVVDYADMIDQALRLVEDPAVAAELADRLDLAVVDEFQDTSPLQLALFTRLHPLAGRSVWVGDGKQCIFEYAGADPLLMDSVIAWVGRQGGTTERLDRNYRSRPELVEACSELFARAFEPLGVSPDSVRTVAARRVDPALARTPPFAVWWLEAKTVEREAELIAEAARRLLTGDDRARVLDRETGTVRAVLARDVGILTATNAEAKRIATALQRAGVRASLPRDGLLQTPEGVLIDAALRWTLEPGDRGARATLEALGGWNGGDADSWLEARLRGDGLETPAWLQPLETLRSQLDVLTPAEALDRAMRSIDAPTLCARWPDPRQRLGNLDALRALAARYEDRCARLRDPATHAGLVRYFAESQRTVLVGDEEQATDDQFAGGTDDAVTVSTYHRAKGLEWPVVVLTSLDRGERRDAFDPCPESERLDFDPDDPLGGRWIRFWPWPFGPQRKVALADTIADTPEGRRVAERERKERVRLLYVGFTRARDQLVLVARQTKTATKTAWLDELCDDAGTPLLGLPTAAGDGTTDVVRIGGSSAACAVVRPGGGNGAGAVQSRSRRFARSERTAGMPRYRITPSMRESGPAGREYLVDRVRSLGAPFPVNRRTDWERLGTAVHAFLAADDDASSGSLRLMRAARIVNAAGLTDAIAPAELIAIADRLHHVIGERWPEASWAHEVPITAFVGAPGVRRRIEGVIDLLLTVPGGVIVIDHKTYPAPSLAAVAVQAASHTAQLALYVEALERCGHTVLGAHLHYPLAGVWVDLRPA